MAHDPAILITGLGVVSPLGVGVDAYWNGLLRGERARTRDMVPGSDLPVSHVHMIDGDYAGVDGIYSVARCAVEEAVRMAGLSAVEVACAGLSLGTGMGASRRFEDIEARGADSPSVAAGAPAWCSAGGVYSVASELAARWHMRGPAFSVSTACSASLYALALATEAIENGEADVMVCMGLEVHSLVALASFNRLAGLDPAGCRAFMRERAGTYFGEGAAALIVESAQHHRQRQGKRRPYARIAGYSYNCDASHPTAPEVEGQQISAMVHAALSEATLEPDDIDAIVPHGTGTVLNDAMEVRVFQRLLGARAQSVPLYPVKTLIGHGGGAAGAFSAATGTLMLAHQTVPGLEGTDDMGFDIHIHHGRAINARLRHVLVNAYAFGGNNASVVLGATNE
jgi:3-oxoacyl-(acyl-carrier-protein) synthase